MAALFKIAKSRSPAPLLPLIGILTTFALIWGAGCAKISEPQPPQARIPKPVTDLWARQVSDSIVLTFSMPVENTDGSPVATLRNIEVFRIDEDLSRGESLDSLPEEEFFKKATRILSIPAPEFPAYLREKTFQIHDRPQFPESTAMQSFALRYAVMLVNKKNQAAGLSNQVLIKPVSIPLPPTNLTAELTEESIRLSWRPPSENMDGSKPARIVGYNIYRSEEASKFPSAPLNSAPLQDAVFEDRNFQYDRNYYYAVSVVASLQQPYAESRLSKEILVVTRDIFPPLPPKEFTAIFDGKSILLLWTPSPSPDVAGYRIYRIEPESSARHLLSDELVSTLSYRDNRTDLKVRYSIVAVDRHGNESSAVTTSVEHQ